MVQSATYLESVPENVRQAEVVVGVHVADKDDTQVLVQLLQSIRTEATTELAE
jgi:hypothetical protein